MSGKVSFYRITRNIMNNRLEIIENGTFSRLLKLDSL